MKALNCGWTISGRPACEALNREADDLAAGLFPGQPEDGHFADTLERDLFGQLEMAVAAPAQPGGLGHRNAIGMRGALDPGGDVHRLAPIVIGHARLADHPADDRAGMDADADVQVDAGRGAQCGKPGDDRLTEADRGIGAVVRRIVAAADCEIRVADRLDLLHPGFGGALVGEQEEGVEQVDQMPW